MGAPLALRFSVKWWIVSWRVDMRGMVTQEAGVRKREESEAGRGSENVGKGKRVRGSAVRSQWNGSGTTSASIGGLVAAVRRVPGMTWDERT